MTDARPRAASGPKRRGPGSASMRSLRTWEGPCAQSRGLLAYVLRSGEPSPPACHVSEVDADNTFPDRDCMMPTKPPIYRPPGWTPTLKRPEVQEPYYQSAEWRFLRQQCLERDRHQCTRPDCQTPHRGHGGRLIADHIVERRDGGADALHNLRTLCSFCDGLRHGHRLRRRL